MQLTRLREQLIGAMAFMIAVIAVASAFAGPLSISTRPIAPTNDSQGGAMPAHAPMEDST